MEKRKKIRIFTLNRKNALAVPIIVLLCCAVAVGVAETAKFTASEAAYVVVIDAGHGGVDGGVVGINTGVKESELNLETAKTLAGYFERAGVNVVLTRKNKYGLYDTATGNFKREDFARRKQIINAAAPDMVISVHMNFFKRAPSRRGAQVFFNPQNGYSRSLAADIQQKLNTEINMNYARRAFSPLAGDYYILNCTPFPAVIVECGFLSNAEDEKLLATESYRKELCYQIFSAGMAYLFKGE